MKRITQKIVLAFVLALIYVAVHGQPDNTYNIPLSSPSDPGKLIVHIIDGSIEVEGYNGNEVIVEVSGNYYDYGGKETKDGLKRIESNSPGFSIEESENTVRVKHNPQKGKIDYVIKVPTNFSVDLGTVNGRVIVVKNTSGNHEVSATNGSITMNNVSGSVIADALNNDIVVTFEQVDASNMMMFSSLNGTVDITFPSNLKADIKATSDWGEIYSDFEIVPSNDPKQVKISNKEKLYKVTSGQGVTGKINGGGMSLTFKTMNGDILIRERKE